MFSPYCKLIIRDIWKVDENENIEISSKKTTHANYYYYSA